MYRSYKKDKDIKKESDLQDWEVVENVKELVKTFADEYFKKEKLKEQGKEVTNLKADIEKKKKELTETKAKHEQAIVKLKADEKNNNKKNLALLTEKSNRLTLTEDQLRTTEADLRITKSDLVKSEDDLRTTRWNLKQTKLNLQTTEENLTNTQHSLNYTR